MADKDLSGLKIDKSQGAYRPARSRKRAVLLVAAAIAVLLVVLAARGVFSPKVEVTTATVSLVYPSQTFTLLNASGYVVAQRKAAVAPKTTGSLEWLGERRPQVRVLPLGANLGFGEANRRGVAAGRGGYVASLKKSRRRMPGGPGAAEQTPGSATGLLRCRRYTRPAAAESG